MIDIIPASPSPLVQPDDPPWLDCLGPIVGEHALVLGRDIGVMCALIRRGCAEVTELQQTDRPEPRTVDLVILPHVATTDGAACAIAHARRGLVGSGRIIVRTGADASGRLGRAIRRILALHGFSAVRLRHDDDRSVLSAELPLFGPLSRA